MSNSLINENERLKQAQEQGVTWRKWGPYLSERQWGTVREDYSENGNAWDYFAHDHSRSRAYQWGEDGLGGISDDKQQLCFALALWNGKDPILKERLFGLTNSEGNHGEDVKEYYFYLDSTPTHSYMKYLYKYPQTEFPYMDLINKNRARDRNAPEYELIDTGIFNDNRYFDVFVEYAKESPEDILIKISVCNRSKETATLHVLPTLWFRNIWYDGKNTRPAMKETQSLPQIKIIEAMSENLGKRYLYCEGDAPLLFTENETNNQRVFGTPNSSRYVKDGINDYVVSNNRDSVNPDKVGTKASTHYHIVLAAGEIKSIRLRLTDTPPQTAEQQITGEELSVFGFHFEEIMSTRKQEADKFYESLSPQTLSAEERRVLRQAMAGMLWSKQYYNYDLAKWLNQRGVNIYSSNRRSTRNSEWFHMVNDDVISMPDKWEYPWYAAWDLAFHTVTLSLVDQQFAKQQLDLMLIERYLHPNGQIPAYEWNFSDVNPPVHAWAAMFNYRLEEQLTGKGDIYFLENVFQKLLMNFTWWVNRKDPGGSNVFQGGFLGLDNIGVFDRSAPLPPGVSLEQADGTAWMAMYCQNMLEIALELARHNPIYEEQAIKFFEHFLWIANAIQRGGNDSLWDEEDGFFYDLLRLPDGNSLKIKVRSMVGLIALCANSTYPADTLDKLPNFSARVQWFTKNHPELIAKIHRPGKQGVGGRYLLSLLDENKLRRVLARMLDEKEFFSPYGIRSLSRIYAENPYSVTVHGQQFGIDYAPAESTTGAFGGNSNWRGPVWMPINALIIRGLLNLYSYYGNNFTIECPTGSGKLMNLFDISKELSSRISRIFLKDTNGNRPVYGGTQVFQTDPYWRDHILFYEYFHGDNGAGIGASHQTGWTGIVGLLMKLFGSISSESMLHDDAKGAVFKEMTRSSEEIR